MVDSVKSQKLLSLILIVFSFIGLINHFGNLLNSIRECSSNLYIYAYLGIILVSSLYLICQKFYCKLSNKFYIFSFIYLHFITMLLIYQAHNLTVIFMLSAIIIISFLLKGTKGLLNITLISIINYFISFIFAFIFSANFSISTASISSYITDLLSIPLMGIFIQSIFKGYEKMFWDLEFAHEETTKNNQLLNNTIAELSTLQEISKFANSVLNIKELINIINDMIIGVIGVNYCSIFLIDEKTDNFYLETTNIQDKNLLKNIKLTLSSKYLPQFKSRGFDVIEGTIADSKYLEADNRNIKTFLITPLQSHRSFLGLIVLESCFDGAFEERKKNMLNTICNQVSIAIENAVIYDKMERLATIDGLTQVYNRRYFNEQCLTQFSNLDPSVPISLAMSDIDFFKKVNDTYGHLTGDAVLKRVAAIIKSTVCADDSDDVLVARYGGEEFVILMKNTKMESAYNILEVVRKNIESSVVEEDGQKIKFTVSIGLSEYPTSSQTITEALRDADSALYRAKQTGKNKVVRATELNN